MLVEGYGDYSLANPQGPLAVSNPEASKWIQVAGLTIQAYAGARGLAGPAGFISRFIPGGGALMTVGGLVGLGYTVKNYVESIQPDWSAADHAKVLLPLGAGIVGGMSPGARRDFARGQAQGEAAQVRVLGNCFPAGTPVATLQGLKPIERIGPGEAVWSFDFRSGQWVRCRVEINHSAVYEGQFVTLRFADGSGLEVTEDHPFWVVEGEGLVERPQLRERDANEDSGLSLPGRWVHSQALRAGDQLYGREGGRLTVVELHCYDDSKEVYNLSVVGLPYYAVGQQGILVHNSETPWGRAWEAAKRLFGYGKPTVPGAEPLPGSQPAPATQPPLTGRLWPNQSPETLAEELAIVDQFNVQPIRVTGPESIAGLAGSPVKFVVSENGELFVIPRGVRGPDGVFHEFSHAVPTRGGDVLAAGEGTVGQGGTTITGSPISGHYKPDQASLEIAREAFRRAGITMPPRN
jgi:hypothetical protein